jgi:hypothetical protein
VIGVLVFHQTWRQQDLRLHAPQYGGQSNRMRGAQLQVGISVELNYFNRRAEYFGSSLCFAYSFLRRAVSRRFSTRTDNEVCRMPGASCLRDNAPASEFNIIGMRAKRQERRSISI